MAPPAPPSHRNATCADSPIVPGRDISGSVVLQPSPTGGGGVDATPVADGAAGYKQCRAKCCGLSGCKAWVVASPSAPKGAAPAPCQPGKPCCWLKGGAASQGGSCPYCTSSVWNPSSGGPSALNEQVGNFALHGPQAPGVTTEAMTGDTLEDVWSQFTAAGADAARAVKPTAVHGAVSATTSVPPGQNRTLVIVLGWHFKTRYFTNSPIGNYYANLHPSAAAAAAGLAARLPAVVDTVRGWHAAFFNPAPEPTVPQWLQDVLVNSMSQWRSAFMTADGRWRQWEAYDCVDVDSVHNGKCSSSRLRLIPSEKPLHRLSAADALRAVCKIVMLSRFAVLPVSLTKEYHHFSIQTS
eukprot:COSAG04_NODE_236_length_19126_cov_8.932885_8_plen_354_part_00